MIEWYRKKKSPGRLLPLAIGFILGAAVTHCLDRQTAKEIVLNKSEVIRMHYEEQILKVLEGQKFYHPAYVQPPIKPEIN